MINAVADRAAALEAARKALRDRIKLSIQQTEFAFASFKALALVHEGVTVGALLIRGPEIHVAILPAYRKRWLSRRLIQETFSPIFKQYGFAVTSVMADNAKGQAFVERLGFKETGRNDNMIHYRLNP